MKEKKAWSVVPVPAQRASQTNLSLYRYAMHVCVCMHVSHVARCLCLVALSQWLFQSCDWLLWEKHDGAWISGGGLKSPVPVSCAIVYSTVRTYIYIRELSWLPLTKLVLCSKCRTLCALVSVHISTWIWPQQRAGVQEAVSGASPYKWWSRRLLFG